MSKSNQEIASLNELIERLDSLFRKAKRENKKHDLRDEAEGLLRQLEHALEQDDPKLPESVIKTIKDLRENAGTETQGFIDRELQRLEEAFQSRRKSRKKQRQFEEAKLLLRRAERELARAELERARRTLEEIRNIEKPLALEEMWEPIEKRFQGLQDECERLQELQEATQIRTEEQRWFNQTQQLLRHVEREIDREGTEQSPKVLIEILQEIDDELEKHLASEELRDSISRQRARLLEECKHLQQAISQQPSEEAKRKFEEAKLLLRRAERELARAELERARRTLEEIRNIEKPLALEEMWEPIEKRFQGLQDECERLQELQEATQIRTEEQRWFNQTQQLLRHVEREIDRGCVDQSPEKLIKTLKEITLEELQEHLFTEELRESISCQQKRLLEECRKLQEQPSEKEKRQFDKAKRLLRRAERELGRAERQKVKKILEEVSGLKSTLALGGLWEPIEQRLEDLDKECKYLTEIQQQSRVNETQQLLLQMERDVDQLNDKLTGLNISRSALVSQPRQDYAEIMPSDELVERLSDITFDIKLYDPEQAQDGYCLLVTWPANKQYAPQISTVLGQLPRHDEALFDVETDDGADSKKTGTSSSANKTIQQEANELTHDSEDDKVVYNEHASKSPEETAEIDDGADSKKTGTSSSANKTIQQETNELTHDSEDDKAVYNGHASKSPEETVVQKIEGQIAVPRVALPPGHYRLALVCNDNLLPGRAEFRVVPTKILSIRGFLERLSKPPDLLERVGKASLMIITLGALAVIAFSLLSLNEQIDQWSTTLITPTPGDLIVTVPPSPIPQSNEFEAVFLSNSTTVRETDTLHLEAGVSTNIRVLPDDGYFFAIRPAGRPLTGEDQLVIADVTDQERRSVSIQTEIEDVKLPPGHYWVSVMVGSDYVCGRPFELEVEALPLEEIIDIKDDLKVQGIPQAEGRWVAVVDQPITFTVELDSIFSREIGGKLLLVESETDAVLTIFTEHLELSLGPQLFSGRGEFTEVREYGKAALAWQSEAEEHRHPLSEPLSLPAIEVVSNVTTTVGSNGGKVRNKPNTDSNELATLEVGSVVQVIGQQLLEEDTWLNVVTEEEVVGWMSITVLEFDEESLENVRIVE